MHGTEPVISLNLQTIGSWFLLIGFSTGLIFLLAFLLMRGFWAQYIDPKLKQLFLDWYKNADTKQDRETEIKTSLKGVLNEHDGEKQIEKIIEGWYIAQKTRDERENFTKKVIDDQINRVDGIIRKEIVNHVDKTEKQLSEEIASLKQDVNTKFDKLNNTSEQILTKLGRMEGVLSMSNKFDTGGHSPIKK